MLNKYSRGYRVPMYYAPSANNFYMIIINEMMRMIMLEMIMLMMMMMMKLLYSIPVSNYNEVFIL